MRIGVFGDIHGDLHSMQRVMEAIDRARPDELVCMGDIVVHGPEPNACVELLRSRPTVRCVKGNHDHGASVPDEEVAGLKFFSRAGYRHTIEAREALTAENQEWLRALPDTVTLAGATFTHATLRSRFELLNNVFTLSQLFQDMRTPLLFAGHSHRSWVHRWDRGRVASFRPLVVERPVRIDPAVPTVVNVGNTAQLLYDRLPPVYVLYDTERAEVTFHEL